MKVYADNAATTKIRGSALKAMNDCYEYFWGNPSSIHSIGRDANDLLERSRIIIANCICANPEEIYFTSGGTESDNLAIASANHGHIITSKFEHPAVLEAVKKMDHTLSYRFLMMGMSIIFNYIN